MPPWNADERGRGATTTWRLSRGGPKVLMIRAEAVADLIGDFQRELLSAGHAIIHDKIVVIDLLYETNCPIITGSQNFGFKASYANDENLVSIRGNRRLSMACLEYLLPSN